jgi:hypothetical protein
MHRLAFAGPGLLVTGIGLAIVTSQVRGLGLAIAVTALTAGGVWLLVRGLRIAVLVTDQQVTVRGWLRSRPIPRTSLRAVTGNPPRLPAITWINQNGRTRATPLVMFADTRGGLAAVKRYNRAALTELSNLVHPSPTKQSP